MSREDPHPIDIRIGQNLSALVLKLSNEKAVTGQRGVKSPSVFQ